MPDQLQRAAGDIGREVDADAGGFLDQARRRLVEAGDQARFAAAQALGDVVQAHEGLAHARIAQQRRVGEHIGQVDIGHLVRQIDWVQRSQIAEHGHGEMLVGKPDQQRQFPAHAFDALKMVECPQQCRFAGPRLA